MRLTLQNFKNYESREFELEGSVAITGRNGSGKTSILEAIMFALYGRNYSKGIAVDGYIRRGEESVNVVLETNAFTIGRRYSSKEGSTVVFNGRIQKQMEIAAKIPLLDLAYCIINPLSLLHDTPPLELRAFFMDNMELPDPIELFKENYSDDPEMVKRFKLGDFEQAKRTVKSLTTTLESLEKDIAVKEGEMLSNKAQIEKIERSRVRRPKGILAKEEDRQKKIDELTEQVGEMKGLKSELQSVKDQLNLIKKKLEGPLEEAGVETISELVTHHEKVVEDISSQRTLTTRVGVLYVTRD